MLPNSLGKKTTDLGYQFKKAKWKTPSSFRKRVAENPNARMKFVTPAVFRLG